MKLHDINLNRLRSFYIVHRERGVRKAAKRLHLTPGAVSSAIKGLEEEVGHGLFTRVGHDMVPTVAADRLFETVARFFGELDGTLSALAGDESVEGTLRVGAPNGFGVETLVPLVQAFRQEHPRVSMVLRFGTPDRQVALLRSGAIDMAVVPRYRGGERFVEVTPLPFRYEPRLVCSARVWQDRLKRRRDYRKVVALEHVALWGGAERIAAWYQRHFRRKPAIAIALEVDNLFAAVSAVHHGPWAALLPDDVIADDLASGALVDLFPKRRQRPSGYDLLRLAGRAPLHLERRFIARLEQGPPAAT